MSTSYACEIERGDVLAARQTFMVSNASGLFCAGESTTLPCTFVVESDADDAGIDSQGREIVEFTARCQCRCSGSLLYTFVAPRARVVRLA